MKKVTYEFGQIVQLTGILNMIRVKGIDQARALAAAAMVIDQGQVTDDGSGDPLGEKDAGDDAPAAGKGDGE